ncbi:MAG: IS66 family transposase [Acidimicrobiales bacterium]
MSYGPRARAIVAYLLARQHVPNRRVAEAMREMFGLEISIGAVDAVYAEAGRRLRGFVAALVAVLKSLPVLHVDETSDRLGTKNIWMHVVSGSLYTLIRRLQELRRAGRRAGPAPAGLALRAAGREDQSIPI